MGCRLEVCEDGNVVGCAGRMRCKCIRKLFRFLKRGLCCCCY